MEGNEYLRRYAATECKGEKERLLREAQELENEDRRVFARNETLEPYKGLVRVFDENGKTTFTDRKWFGEEEVQDDEHILFSIGKEKRGEKMGKPATVATLDQFKTQFLDQFARILLNEMNWDNVVAAGGSITACVQPVPSEEESIGRYFERQFPSSDIDLFLYGLTPEQANSKLVEIYDAVCDSCPAEVVCFRSSHAVTMVSEFPYRHVQVVLRLYSSPYEVLAGFDIDSCTFLFDGDQVYTTPRGHHALMNGYNTVDVSRRSPSYEVRLAKYAERGFEVFVPGYQRSLVNVQVFRKPWNELKGLERLIVLENLESPAERLQYSKMRNSTKAKWDQYARFEKKMEESDYATLFLPWGPEYDAAGCMESMFMKDLGINHPWIRKDRTYFLHPCFFGTAEEILEDCSPNDPPIPADVPEDELQGYVRGKLTWIQDDPGRQMIGSFNPISDTDWRAEALFAGLDSALLAILARDSVDELKFWLEQHEDKQILRKLVDSHMRSLLHHSLLCGSTACSVWMLESDLVDPSLMTGDGLSAIHLAVFYNRLQELPALFGALKRHFSTKKEKSSYGYDRYGRLIRSRSDDWVYKSLISRHRRVNIRFRGLVARLSKQAHNAAYSKLEDFHEAVTAKALQCAIVMGRVDAVRSLLQLTGENQGLSEGMQTFSFLHALASHKQEVQLELMRMSLTHWSKYFWREQFAQELSNSPAVTTVLEIFIRSCTDLGKRKLLTTVMRGFDLNKSPLLCAVSAGLLDRSKVLFDALPHASSKSRKGSETETIVSIAARRLLQAWRGEKGDREEAANLFLWTLQVDREHKLGALDNHVYSWMDSPVWESNDFADGLVQKEEKGFVALLQNAHLQICSSLVEIQDNRNEAPLESWLRKTNKLVASTPWWFPLPFRRSALDKMEASVLKGRALNDLWSTLSEQDEYERMVVSMAKKSCSAVNLDEDSNSEIERTIETKAAEIQSLVERAGWLSVLICVVEQEVATRKASKRLSLRRFLPSSLRRSSSSSRTLTERVGDEAEQGVGSSATVLARQSLPRMNVDELVSDGRIYLEGQRAELVEQERRRRSMSRKKIAKEVKRLRMILLEQFGISRTLVQDNAESVYVYDSDASEEAENGGLDQANFKTVSDNNGKILDAFRAAFRGDWQIVACMSKEVIGLPYSILSLVNTEEQPLISYCVQCAEDPAAAVLELLACAQSRVNAPQDGVFVTPEKLFLQPFRIIDQSIDVKRWRAVQVLKRFGPEFELGDLCKALSAGNITLETFAVITGDIALFEVALQLHKALGFSSLPRDVDFLCVAFDRLDFLRILLPITQVWWWSAVFREIENKSGDGTHQPYQELSSVLLTSHGAKRSVHANSHRYWKLPTWIEIACACGSRDVFRFLYEGVGGLQEVEDLVDCYLEKDAQLASTAFRLLETYAHEEPLLHGLKTAAQVLIALRVYSTRQGLVEANLQPGKRSLLYSLVMGTVQDDEISLLEEYASQADLDTPCLVSSRGVPFSPVHVAATAMNPRMLRKLVHLGANPLVQQSNTGSNFVHLLCLQVQAKRSNHFEVLLARRMILMALESILELRGEDTLRSLLMQKELPHLPTSCVAAKQLLQVVGRERFDQAFPHINLPDEVLDEEEEQARLAPVPKSRFRALFHFLETRPLFEPEAIAELEELLEAFSDSDADLGWPLSWEDDKGKTLVDAFLLRWATDRRVPQQVPVTPSRHPLFPYLFQAETTVILRKQQDIMS